MRPHIEPCPFCGTHPDSTEHPAGMIEIPHLQLECGKCGAGWPIVRPEDMDSKFADEAAIIEYWNVRPTTSEEGKAG